MDKESIITIEDALRNISQDIFEQTEDEDIYLELKSNGWMAKVSFCGFTIWDSENNDRDVIYESEDGREDRHEEYETCFRKRIMKALKKLSVLKL